ncbi:hypothetical protein ACPA54_30075 [Uniformispora flossi]|uniref:hypothetical protein n=1 Tax=Uniformispora flossi TaxID=3390723 RepID=UPI003C2F9EEB
MTPPDDALVRVPDDPRPEYQQALRNEIERTAKTYRIGTFNYGVTYYLSRIFLIVSSSVVAAGNNLADGKASTLIAWIPALSVAVAAITALDTWLKPQQKWQGFMESRDRLEGLMSECEAGLPPDQARARLTEIRTEHRSKNIF